MNYIIAAGIWPALPITGFFLLRKIRIGGDLKSTSVLTVFSLYTLAGMALWSVPMAVAAAACLYSGTIFGALGWIATAVSIVLRFNRKGENSQSEIKIAFPDYFLALILTLAGISYFFNPAESIVGGRDMGVYTNHAIFIAHHGRLDIPYFWQNTADSSLAEVSERLPALIETSPTVTVQFAHLYPVWLAQSFSSFDFQGLIRFNGVIALLSLCLIYGCCTLVLPIPFALSAVFVIGMNPGQLWLSHVTLAELFTQLSVWGGIYMICMAIKSGSKYFSVWGGIFIGFSFWIRLDSFLILPLIFLSHFLYRVLREDEEQEHDGVWIALYVALFLTFLAGATYHLLTTFPYLISLAHQLLMIDYLLIFSAAMMFITMPRLKDSVGRILQSRWAAIFWSVVLFIVFVYSIWLRNRVGNFSISQMPNGDIIRDFREDSLVNLTKYLSFLVVCAAPIGLMVFYWKVFIGKKSFYLIPLVVVSCGFSFLYLWNPSIAPDHFWAIRRFVPVVIPGFTILSAVGIDWTISVFLSRWKYLASVVLLIFVIVFLIQANYFQMSVSEQKGYYEQLYSLAELLPKDKLVLTDDGGAWGTWETPLFLSFDRKIVPLNFGREPERTVIANYIRRNASTVNPVYLVYEGPVGLNGLIFKKREKLILRRAFVEPSFQPLPDSIIFDERTIRVYPVEGIFDSLININIGRRPLFNIEESGFYNMGDEVSQGRWTNGRASLNIPINEKHRPNAIRVELGATNPDSTSLSIKLNQIEVFSQVVAPGKWTKTVLLKEVPITDNLLLELKSNTFVPANVSRGSLDTRKLGVFVEDITLLENYTVFLNKQLEFAALRSLMKIEKITQMNPGDPTRSMPFKVVVKNAGTKAWPSFSDLGSYKGSVRLGMKWYSQSNARKPILEQRVDLLHALLPDESVELRAVLNPVDNTGRRLPIGRYSVTFGMLQEGYRWFETVGDSVVKITIALR